LVSP